MFLRRNSLRVIPLLLCAILSQRAAADDVAVYLERLGLTELLAAHLEQKLDSAVDEERDELLLRLAGIYAQLLETITDPARRLELEQRSRQLLASAPAGSTDELHLALLRASFRSAEKIAEQHRLRQCNVEEVERAKETLSEIIPDLDHLRRQIEENAERAERRLARATGSSAVMLADEAEKARRLHAQCTFLTAWALYYQSWLNDRPGNAKVAQRLFAELLNFGDNPALPENVSVDLRSVEAIARCILGMALCKSLTASTATAIEWVELIEHERTFEPLREQAPAWKIAIHLENDEFRSVRSVLDEYTASGATVPLHWLRLVAVYALEAEDRSRDAAELARHAVTKLAAGGELAQVFDLAERYGVDSLGTAGFARRYVGGVLRYFDAREAHGGDLPTSDTEVEQLYDEAIAEFLAAEREPDADRYSAARPHAARLIAWCKYFQGRLASACEAFEHASEGLSADDAPEALWMAVVCLDELVEADPDNTALADRFSQLVSRFLAEYPSSAHAPKLILRRALMSGEVSPEVADELLAIPANSDVYNSAQRRAAQIIYRLFRDSRGPQRIAWGCKYLPIAIALHVQDEQDLDLRDESALARYLAGARRILEVALQEGIGELSAVQTVLADLGELQRAGEVDLDDIESELTYRRMQRRLLSDDVDAAMASADELWSRNRNGIWSRLASRAMFKHADKWWRNAMESREDDRPAVAMIVRYGRRVLGEYEDDPAALEHAGVLAHHATVAEASMTIYERSNDQEHGMAALALFEKLLEAKPRNARFLRSTAILSESLGKPRQALDCWRTLVAGSAQGTERWYEAKFHLISLLARTDPDRARAVMSQHKQLNPDYGPNPWGARLRALDLRLGPEAEAGK